MTPQIRTTNWNAMNKFRYTTSSTPNPYHRKFLIVQKILKRYDLWDMNGVVVHRARGAGKTTAHKIITEAYTLSLLAIAIRSGDRDKIKQAINTRINTRGQRIWLLQSPETISRLHGLYMGSKLRKR